MLGHIRGTWLFDEFDRNGAIEQLVEGSEDATHAALANRFLEALLAAQCRLLNLDEHYTTFPLHVYQGRGAGHVWCV